MINIILVSDRMVRPKTLNTVQSIGLLAGLILIPVFLTLLFITPKQAIKTEGVRAMLPPHLRGAMLSSQSHLDAYAKQVGELQARIMRLDAQNQRLSKLAGIQPEQKSQNGFFSTVGGQGGPLVKQRPMTEDHLKQAISAMIEDLDARDEYVGKLEAKLLQQSVLKEMLPNSSPVEAAYSSSSYGWRIDPLSGHRAFHEGLDFPASVGTPVYAAADGIVAESTHTIDYGNLIKIDHGSGLETRYAHNARLLVKVGERVAKGQKIALVGNTGRSTGPHLHYEIRLNGNPLDPRQYLQKQS